MSLDVGVLAAKAGMRPSIVTGVLRVDVTPSEQAAVSAAPAMPNAPRKMRDGM
jgi:hypothetical protein